MVEMNVEQKEPGSRRLQPAQPKGCGYQFFQKRRRAAALQSAIARNRRGSAFITALIFLVVLLGLGASFVGMSLQEVVRASRARKENRALALAEAGLDYAAWRIYNETPTSYPITFARTDLPEGSFSATVDIYLDADGNPVPNSLLVVSTGLSQGWTAQVKAVGQYLISPGENSSVFDNALFSDADMEIQGTADIIGSVHSNANITVKGSPSVVGDVSAAGWINDPNKRIQGTTTPYSAKKSLPTVDLQYYRGKASKVYSRPQTFSGTIDLDGVIFVDGDVDISGQVSGKGVVVATGTIRVNGNVTLANPDSDAFALISTKKVKVNGTARIEGAIYAHNAEMPAVIEGLGTADVLGAVVADLITSGGTLKVEYEKPTVEMPGASEAPVQLDVISWRRVR